MPQGLPSTLEEAHREIEHLRQQCDSLKKLIFGAKSEKRQHTEKEEGGAQLNLFSGPEATEQEAKEEAKEEVSVPAHTRKKKKGGRRPLPEELPREEVFHDITDEEKVCSCGCEKHRMGEDVTEEVEIIPAKVFVRRHVRPKYNCRRCSGSIAQAPLPARPIKRCLAGPKFLAWMIVSKHADHIPLCRMERIFARLGIDITRSNMCEWAMRLHDLCRPLIAEIKKKLLASEVIHSDDTPIRVQQPGGGPTKQSYLWVYLGDSHAPYTVYDFTNGRSRAGPNEILSNYTGFLQADAYTGYDALYHLTDKQGNPRILEVACWAHTRRYFIKAEEAGAERATEMIKYIKALYKIEEKGKKLTDSERLQLRQEHSVPILKKMKEWLDSQFDVLPESPLGKAIGYALNNWAALERYAADGRLAIDNNPAERALRPIAVGRKNWLFAGSERGGAAAATFFTLIESARRAGHNPIEYLRDIFTRLPNQNIKDLAPLLPNNWKPSTT